LRNAFRQVPIYRAMGWDVPEFAHVPLIHGPDGKKLSKRHGAQSTLEYKEMGYLPEAMTSYLMKLGWSHGDQDIFTMEEAAEVFDTSGIGKAPARLDFDKLADVNRHYLRKADPERLMDLLGPYLDPQLGEKTLSAVQQALPSVIERAASLPELAEAVAFLTSPRPLSLNKNARKALKGEGLDRLSAMRDLISGVADFDALHLQDAIQAYCTAQDLGLGKVGPPLRAALTGGLPAPDLAPVMAWLGRDETLARIDDQLAAARDDT
ncbi:MAG: glutamate--tRNA ligase family protein, partial [Hyphomonadaceae bacterium]|nr:glutamate--tRNA ligase family protein [Hyphomonadaceae bacterium]